MTRINCISKIIKFNSIFLQRRYQLILSVSFIIAITFISFLSSLDNGFTNWDDQEYVTNNYLIRELSWDNLKIIFTSFDKKLFSQPLVLLTFSLEYYLFQLNPFIYHLDNLLLHVINSLLVFYFIALLSKNHISALFAGIFFGIHPLHVESVAWISERKDVLSTFFFLQAAIFYLLCKEKNKRVYYCLSLAVFILSLLSKAMTVTLPVVLCLCDYLAKRTFDRKTILEKIPFFTVSGIFVIINLSIHKSADAIDSLRLLSPIDNLLIACRSVILYLTKALLPINLSAYYPYPKAIGILMPEFFFSFILFLILAVAVYYSRRYTRKVIFGTLFFLVTLLPVLKLIPFGGGGAAMADRYMYIPSIGLFYMAGVAVNSIYNGKAGNRQGQKRILTLFIILIIMSFSTITYQRCKVWRDDNALWSDVVGKYPDSILAHYNLGRYYQQKGFLIDSISSYREAIRLNPSFINARNNLGTTLGQQGKYREALIEFKEVLRADPTNIEAGYNLAYTYIIIGDCLKAREETTIIQQMDRSNRIGDMLSAKCRSANQHGSVN